MVSFVLIVKVRFFLGNWFAFVGRIVVMFFRFRVEAGGGIGRLKIWFFLVVGFMRFFKGVLVVLVT